MKRWAIQRISSTRRLPGPLLNLAGPLYGYLRYRRGRATSTRFRRQQRRRIQSLNIVDHALSPS
jgi:hypothetical protein